VKRNALRRQLFAGVAVIALALTACGNNDDNGDNGGSNGEALSGEVVIDGSSTVEPLSSAAAALYQEEQPEVQVTVGTSGTGGGFERFCAGETDISDASRPIDEDEIAACEENGIEYAELTVANDAITVVVNAENDWAQCLTIEQLNQIWAPDSTINNWNQVDPSFPDVPLTLFSPGTDSGTFGYFTEAVNGEEGASRTDATTSEDDNVLVQGVANERGALGYFGFTYYEENADSLRAVQIDSGSGCVEPSAETVQDGSYTPLGRPLFIYISAQALEEPQVEDFVRFYIENIDTIVEEAAFIPLNDEQRAALEDAFAEISS